MEASPPNIPLNPLPRGDWEQEFNRLVQPGSWLARKVNRTRRLKEHWEYLRRYAQDLWSQPHSRVIDLGCGPGETLEIARMLGHRILGVDAASGDGGMGDEYLRASALLCERQQIPTFREGLRNWLTPDVSSFYETGALLINSRGSWEQMHADMMDGEPHHQHHRADQMTWRIDSSLHDRLEYEFQQFAKMLRQDGSLLIHCNGSKNHEQMEEALLASAKKVGLRLVIQESRLYKWRRKLTAEKD